MAIYRLYCLDGAGSVSLADWFEADGDVAALAAAKAQHPYAMRCEVWCGLRLVGTLDSRKGSDA